MTINAITAEDELMYKQLSDPKLREIAEQIELRGSKGFTLIDGLLFRIRKDRELFVVPDGMVNNIIRLYHDEVGHVGIDKTVQRIVDHYWFPNLKLRIKQYIENCVRCLSYSLVADKTEGELIIYDKDTVPFQTIHIDHFGPLEQSKNKSRYILVIVDACTKFVWLFPTKSTGAKEVIERLLLLFGLTGTPRRIVSDRGTAFTSHDFAEFMESKNVKHVLTAVASPWANGQVERVNRFLKSTLAKVADDPSGWEEKLSAAQYAINNTYHRAISATPSKALFGCEQRRDEDEQLRMLIDEIKKIDVNYADQRDATRQTAREVNRKIQEYNKADYDDRHKKITRYKEGDLVLVRKLQFKVGENTKLAPKYKGPYRIKAIFKNNRFVVTDVPGYNLTSKPFNTILSADKLKPWIHVGQAADNPEREKGGKSETDDDDDQLSGEEE